MKRPLGLCKSCKLDCNNVIELINNGSETEEIKCDEFVFSKDIYKSSSVTEFNLVCDRNHLKVYIL